MELFLLRRFSLFSVWTCVIHHSARFGYGGIIDGVGISLSLVDRVVGCGWYSR